VNFVDVMFRLWKCGKWIQIEGKFSLKLVRIASEWMAIFHHFGSPISHRLLLFFVWICLSNFILAAGLWSKVFVWRRANGRRQTAGELNGRRCAPGRLIVSAGAESVRVATFQRSAEQRSVDQIVFHWRNIFRIFSAERHVTWRRFNYRVVRILLRLVVSIVLCFGKSSVCFYFWKKKCRRLVLRDGWKIFRKKKVSVISSWITW
jgi:hypothetical protein